MSVISESVRTRRHNGPRNLRAITDEHIKENGARPSTLGLKGDAKRGVLTAQKRWDAGLMGRSTVIAQVVNNDICRIDNAGYIGFK
jgi:hypothetical protein